jgi:threonine dehydrogenase-like Zn-dependent dehydrogenase
VVETLGQGAALAADGARLEPGQRVILKPNLVCGTCVNCLADRSNACQTLQWIGCDPSGAHPGAMAEFFLAPAGNLFVTPGGVSDEAAALVECLATPVHAARRAGDLNGAAALVIGAGTIGLFAVIAARLAGAGRIVVSDLDAAKRERALAHGADAAVDANDPGVVEAARSALGGPADVVFECVAGRGSVAQAIGVLRRAGNLMVVGVPAGETPVPLALVQDWEIRLQGCANYTPADFAAAIQIAAAGGLPAAAIVSQVFPLAQVAAAFAAASQNASGKVMVRP